MEELQVTTDLKTDQEIQKVLKNKNPRPKNMVYGVGNASKLIVKILEKTKLNNELLQKSNRIF